MGKSVDNHTKGGSPVRGSSHPREDVANQPTTSSSTPVQHTVKQTGVWGRFKDRFLYKSGEVIQFAQRSPQGQYSCHSEVVSQSPGTEREAKPVAPSKGSAESDTSDNEEYVPAMDYSSFCCCPLLDCKSYSNNAKTPSTEVSPTATRADYIEGQPQTITYKAPPEPSLVRSFFNTVTQYLPWSRSKQTFVPPEGTSVDPVGPRSILKEDSPSPSLTNTRKHVRWDTCVKSDDGTKATLKREKQMFSNRGRWDRPKVNSAQRAQELKREAREKMRPETRARLQVRELILRELNNSPPTGEYIDPITIRTRSNLDNDTYLIYTTYV